MRLSHIRFRLRQLTEDLRDFKTNNWKFPTNAQIYDRKTSATGDYQDFLTTEYLKELTTRIEPHARLLDLGCGTGVLSLALAKNGFRVTGVDISEAMLELLRQKMGDLGIELKIGDVFNLPFGDDTFDGIITRWVVPHFPDWPLVIREAARVLKPGGVFVFDICSTPNYELASGHRKLNYGRFGSDPVDESAKGFYASATEHEIKLVANVARIELEAIVPNGLYRNNAVFAASLGPDDHEQFNAAFEEFYKDEKVKDFVQWFERAVTRRLPLGLVNTVTVITRKPSQ